jgi:hypothetical protein
MNNAEFLPDSEVLQNLVSFFERAAPESRERLFQTLGTYLGLSAPVKRQAPTYGEPRAEGASAVANFTEDRSLTAKEFISQKQPRTDVERVACLAYYLTHYMNTPHFKTVDISRLNTEAAQIKFSNAAVAVENATGYGYLVPAGKGFKQISALGEEYVTALPDRDAAKAAISRRRRPRRKSKTGAAQTVKSAE